MKTPAPLECYSKNQRVAGCDEAGRGCLAGPVAAAAVVLPADFYHPLLNDSKKLSAKQRNKLRTVIEAEALAWGIAFLDNQQIDQYNILRASIMAMHKALDQIQPAPELILADGNHFNSYRDIPHQCVIKGDGTYLSIAAASVLAKTHRDAFMEKLHNQYPAYGWASNKGYPTRQHRDAIDKTGYTPYHRLTYKSGDKQMKLAFHKKARQ